MQIKLIRPTSLIPTYQTHGAAGLDLHADLTGSVDLAPGCTRSVPTGVAIHIDAPGLMGRVYVSDDLPAELVNNTKVIHSDYQGEIVIHLRNTHPHQSSCIRPGMRIAQLVFTKIERVELDFVTEFSTLTSRGSE